MLLPYNVDRPARHLPVVTYGIIGLNVFIFLMTLVVSNTNLPSDRIEARTAITRIMREINAPDSKPTLKAPAPEQDSEGDGSSEAPSGDADGSPNVGESAGGESAGGGSEGIIPTDLVNYSEHPEVPVPKGVLRLALLKSMKNIDAPGGYKIFWQIQHANDTFVLEPHYSTLDTFAYRPGDPSPLSKIIGLFGSMFLHSGIEHIVGNMLFLWIFGRALEDVLGSKFFTGIYLSSGVAATLLFHLITVRFTPDQANVPLMGASGAISGVMGLFAVRFYRTKVRVFYLSLPLILAIPGIGTLLLLGMLLYFFAWFFAFYLIFHVTAPALILALVAFGGTLLIFGRDWAWGAFRAPSMWVIGVYMVAFNLFPAVQQIMQGVSGGTAYWAHIGGFSCGALYAFLIGGVDEGKSEYALEDAQIALQKPESADALERAQKLLDKAPDNPAALEVAARALDRQENTEGAAAGYVKAIAAYWRAGEREPAARLYLFAAENYPWLSLSPAIMAGMSSLFVKSGQTTEAAALLVRIIEEHSTSPEAEMALLKAGQMWMKDFDDPVEATRLFAQFLTTYPHSEWAPQATKALQLAHRAAESRPPQPTE